MKRPRSATEYARDCERARVRLHVRAKLRSLSVWQKRLLLSDETARDRRRILRELMTELRLGLHACEPAPKELETIA